METQDSTHHTDRKSCFKPCILMVIISCILLFICLVKSKTITLPASEPTHLSSSSVPLYQPEMATQSPTKNPTQNPSTTIPTIAATIKSVQNVGPKRPNSNHFNLQMQLDTLSRDDISDTLINTKYLNKTKVFKPKNGFDLQRIFQHKTVLFRGDSIIGLFYRLLIQSLYYCTPNITLNNKSTKDLNASRVNYIRIHHTNEALHPCGSHFCDFMWNYTLFIIEPSVSQWQNCMFGKIDSGWGLQYQNIDFQNHLHQLEHHSCGGYFMYRTFHIIQCSDYVKKEDYEILLNKSNSNYSNTAYDFLQIQYDIIVDEQALMHVFHAVSSRMFEPNTIKKMHLLPYIMQFKMKQHSLYDVDKDKCYIFMSTDPICEHLVGKNYNGGKHAYLEQLQMQYRSIQETVRFNVSTSFDEAFDLELLSENDMKLTKSCVKSCRKDFIALNMNITEQYMIEYCIKFAFTDYGAEMVSNYVEDIVVNLTKTEFHTDRIFFHDRHAMFHNLSGKCESKHHTALVHSTSYYAVEVVTLLNVFDLLGC